MCANKKKESGAPKSCGKHGADDTRTRRSARGVGWVRADGRDGPGPMPYERLMYR
jgi:hypothetical protein